MMAPSLHPDESRRLQAVRALGLFGSEPAGQLEDLTQAVASALAAPVAMITIIDSDQVWFLSCVGLAARQGPRCLSICGHTILQDQVLTVPDTRSDLRFHNNPAFEGPPPIRAYAGVAIDSADGLPVGTLCVLDHVPRQFSDADRQTLSRFAGVIRRELLSQQALNQTRATVQAQAQALAASERRFQSVFEKAAIGMAIVDAAGRWIQVNDALCRIVGYSQAELQHLTFQDITCAEDLDADLALVTQLVAGEMDRYQLEKRYIRKNGELVWINLSVAIERDAQGGHYFISAIEDIQARKDAENSIRELRLGLEQTVQARTEALRQANERLLGAMVESLENETKLRSQKLELRTIIENAPDAYVCIDEAGVICDWNTQAEQTFGWSREEAIGRRIDDTIIPSRYRHAHVEGLRQFKLSGNSKVIGKRMELSAMRRDGSILPIEIRIQHIEVGGQRRFTAFLHDISDRKAADRAQQEQRKKLQLIADNIPAMISYLDTDLRYRFANQAYMDQLGVAPEQLIGQEAGGFFRDSRQDEVRAHLQRALAGEVVSWEYERSLHGVPRYWLMRYVPDRVGDRVVGLHGMVMDITDRKLQEISKDRDATVDILTGLLNRRGLFKTLESLLATDRSAGEPLGVILLDLDKFKMINDRQGHAVGDAVLHEIGRRLGTLPDCIASRLGGDEFVLLYPRLDRGERTLTEAVDTIGLLLSEPVQHQGSALFVSASIGHYLHQLDRKLSPEALLQIADAAMYRSKRRRARHLRRAV